MDTFKARISQHVQHVAASATHCATEETTKQALILPLLDILGFSPFDPTKVKAEYSADINGIKAGERVDYALFVEGGAPVMFIEAKSCKERLSNHASQLARYFNATPGVKISAITNGIEWRFFTDLNTDNIMDTTPFFSVNLAALNDSDAEKLANFRADQFQPERIKTFAEERLYVEAFTGVIKQFLRDPDTEFVKFVTVRASLTPKLTAKFLEAMTPIVKQAVAAAISGMVVSSLSQPQVQEPSPLPETTNDGDWVNPDNEKIITTPDERKLAEIITEILDGKTSKDDLVWKDTESYFAVLYQGKTNRWLVHYFGSRKTPLINFCLDLTAQHLDLIKKSGLEVSGANVTLSKPSDIMKLSPIIFDALDYCQNDENFRVKRKKDSAGNAE